MDIKEKTCCFSGHRDITVAEYPDIAYQLELKIFDLICRKQQARWEITEPCCLLSSELLLFLT